MYLYKSDDIMSHSSLAYDKIKKTETSFFTSWQETSHMNRLYLGEMSI